MLVRISYSDVISSCTYLSADVKHPLAEVPKHDVVMSSQHIEAQDQTLQTSHQNQSGSKVENKQPSNLDHKTAASQILICCEGALYFYLVKSLVQVLSYVNPFPVQLNIILFISYEKSLF